MGVIKKCDFYRSLIFSEIRKNEIRKNGSKFRKNGSCEINYLTSIIAYLLKPEKETLKYLRV